MLAKNLVFLSRADTAGVVLGARVPVILTSRADLVRSRMASCAAAVLYADAQAPFHGATRRAIAMDAILVVNAGSSSVKFQIFGLVGGRAQAPDQGPDRRNWHSAPLQGGGQRRFASHRSFVSVPRNSGRAGIDSRDRQVAARIAVAYRLAELGHRVGIAARSPTSPCGSTATCSRSSNATSRSLRCISQTILLRSARCWPRGRSSCRWRASTPRSIAATTHVADRYAIPERFYAEGVRRYGFHGLSYEYVVDRLRTVAPDVAAGRIVVAHLGSGASMCAIADGRSVESTMGFTALDGLPMGTRPGQIDPGVVLYLLSEKGMILLPSGICSTGKAA